jgi:putative oxidoreductase
LGLSSGIGYWVLFERVLMRRLFSSFARGWPGVGLLLLRIVSGGFLIADGVERCRAGEPIGSLIVGVFAIVDGALLAAGLWTPIAGPLVIALSTWGILVQHADPDPGILLAAMGVALALVGPGALSLDARLFGWKRIDLEKY